MSERRADEPSAPPLEAASPPAAGVAPRGRASRRAALADTLTSVLFFSTMGALTEVFVARMSVDQVLVSRLAALPVMIFSGRPYGLWRDWIVGRLAPGGTPLRTALADTTAFVTFQLPIYLAILWFAGASIEQASVAAGSALIVLLVTARPYGVLLGAVRRLFGAPRRSVR